MRATLPFNGLIKAKGHIVYQIALLTASFYIYGYQTKE